MRRPTAPAQRTPPRRPEPPAQSSVVAEPVVAEPVDQPVAAQAVEREPLTEPIDLTARLAAGASADSGEGAETGAGGADERGSEPDADAAAPSGFTSWRAVRRASAERRRVERGEARRFTARTRRRRQLQLAVVGFVVLVIGGAVATAYSPAMALRHIEVVGAHSLKAGAVRQALANELGKPLPLVTSADVRHDLDDFRLIESYSTQLEPPSTLVVRITERSPLAAVKAGASFELIDQAGVVLSAASSAPAGYPVVTLPAGQQPESSASYAAAASILAALPQPVRATVTAVSAASANDVTLTLKGGKKVIWGGADQLELKTADLRALLKGAARASVYDVSSPRAPITR